MFNMGRLGDTNQFIRHVGKKKKKKHSLLLGIKVFVVEPMLIRVEN